MAQLQISLLEVTNPSNKIVGKEEDLTVKITFDRACEAEETPEVTFTNTGFTLKTPFTLDEGRTFGTAVFTAGNDNDEFTITAQLTGGNSKSEKVLIIDKTPLQVASITASKASVYPNEVITATMTLNRKMNKMVSETRRIYVDNDNFTLATPEETMQPVPGNDKAYTLKFKGVKIGSSNLKAEVKDQSGTKHEKSTAVSVVKQPIGVTIQSIECNERAFKGEDFNVKIVFNAAIAEGLTPEVTMSGEGFTVKTPFVLDGGRSFGTMVLTPQAQLGSKEITFNLDTANQMKKSITIIDKTKLAISKVSLSPSKIKPTETSTLTITLNRDLNPVSEEKVEVSIESPENFELGKITGSGTTRTVTIKAKESASKEGYVVTTKATSYDESSVNKTATLNVTDDSGHVIQEISFEDLPTREKGDTTPLSEEESQMLFDYMYSPYVKRS